MEMLIGKKCILKINQLGKIYKFNGVICDQTQDNKKVWVEANNDIYCTTLENVEIIEEVQEQTNKIKGSAKVKFSKYENKNCFDEVEYRTLGIDLIITSDTKENVEMLFDRLIDKLQELSDLDINLSTCPDIDEDTKTGKWSYIEGFDVEYEHGQMTAIKKDFMKVFKQVKKDLGIK